MMDYQSQDGQVFTKQLAHFVRTHEKALANALQLQRKPPPRKKDATPGSLQDANSIAVSPPAVPTLQSPASSGSHTALAAAFSLPSLSFTSTNVKPQKLILNLNHLYYLLSRFEDLGINVGPMNVRLENLNADNAHSNYVSFLNSSHRSRRSADNMSIHSVSSVRSVMSSVSSMWSNFGFGGSSVPDKNMKAKMLMEQDLKYLYSAFTKIPCLRLVPPDRSKLIENYEEFPFDTAVPILAFKNLSALELTGVDVRGVFGWDQISERVRSLIVRRGSIDDPAELIIALVLDDIDRRRRRSSKNAPSPITWNANASAVFEGPPSVPGSPKGELGTSADSEGQAVVMSRGPSGSSTNSPRSASRPRSSSPKRPSSSRNGSARHHSHHSQVRGRRSDSGSSKSSGTSALQGSQILNNMGTLPPAKWRFLRHLSLSDNSLTQISTSSMHPLAGSLTSLDLSDNLFTTVPEALSLLTNLRALNLSNNMIESLHSLTKITFPAVTALNLRKNRLQSIAGIERIASMERLDLRENKLTDPAELARLTGAAKISEIWVAANPFVKSYSSSYRATIFNLFRNSGIHDDDVILDSHPPSASEKRYLVDRAPPPPAIKLLPEPEPAPPVNAPIVVDSRNEIGTAQMPAAASVARPLSQQEINYAIVAKSARKKSQNRRRMVELTRGDSTSAAPDYSDPPVRPPESRHQRTESLSSLTSKPLPPTPPSARPAIIQRSPPPLPSTLLPPNQKFDLPSTLLPQAPKFDHQALLAQYARMAPPTTPHNESSHPRIMPSIMLPSEALGRNGPLPNRGPNPPLSPPPLTITTSPTEGGDWNVRGDEYRKKIEALRSEVGTGWLSVLSDDHWDNQRLTPGGSDIGLSPGDVVSPASTIRPSPITPISNQQYNNEYTRQPRNFQELKASDA